MQSLAHFSISHRRIVIATWLVLLVGSIGTAGVVKNHFNNNLTLPNTGTQKTTDLLRAHFPALSGDSDQVVFHSSAGPLTSAANRARIAASLAAVSALPHVVQVVSPFATANAISHDRRTGFATIAFDERGDALP